MAIAACGCAGARRFDGRLVGRGLSIEERETGLLGLCGKLRSAAGPSAAAACGGGARAGRGPGAGPAGRGAARSSRRRADQPLTARGVGRRRRAGDERPRLRDAARLPRWDLQAWPRRELGRLERRHAPGGARAQRRPLARPPRVRRARRAGDGRAALAVGHRRAGAARRAGRRRVDRARDRADRPFRAQASLRLRAAGALRRADAPRPSRARHPPGGVADRAPAGGDGAVSFRRLGPRQADPARARARVLGRAGRRRRDPLRPRSRRGPLAQPHAAGRDRRPVTRDRRALPGSGRADHLARWDHAAPPALAPLFVPRGQSPALPAQRSPLSQGADDALGSNPLRRRAAQRSGPPDRWPPSGRRSSGAGARSPARGRGAGRRRLPRQRRRRRARSPGASHSPDAARAGGQPAVPRRGARLRAGGAQGRHPGRPPAGRRGDDPAAAEARRVRSRAPHLGGDARRGSRAALWGGRGVQLRRLPLERARGADRRGAGRRGTGRARADPGAHRAPPLRRAAGDLPLSLRHPGAGVDARARAGRGRRQVRSPARLARP